MTPADGPNDISASRFAGGAGHQPVAVPAEPSQDDIMRLDEANAALVTAAQMGFPANARAADDGYSRQLRERSAQVSRYMQREHGSREAGAIYLDPNEFSAGTALGLSGEDTVRAMLAARHVQLSDEAIKNTAENMVLNYRTPTGEVYTTQNPHAQLDYFTNGPQVCVIAPVSSYFPPELQLNGFTHQQNLDFINGHEGWHCKDTRNNFVGLDPAQYARIDIGNPQGALANPQQLQMYSIANRQETLADVGSMGDLIRHGGDPALINSVIDWRRSYDDPTHMTIAGLQGLQQRIQEMGVERFRHLSDDQARALYNDVAEHGALTPAQMAKVIDYRTGSADHRAQLQAEAATNPDTRAALDRMAEYRDAPAGPQQPQPLNPREQAVANQLRQWDAEQLLQDRAFHDGHKITPETLIRAYGHMQEELRRDIARHPDDPLLQLKAEKLQASFEHVTQDLDYVTANAQRGVNLYRTEPVLRGHDQPEALPDGATLPGRKHAPAPADHAPQISQASPATPAVNAAGSPRRPTPGM